MYHLVIINQQYPPETAATGQIAQQLARSLARSGRFESVTVVCGRAYYEDAGGAPDRDGGDGVIVRRLWNTAFPKSSIPGKLFNQLTFMLALLFWRAPRHARVLVTTAPPLAVAVLAAKNLLGGFRLYMSAQDLYPDVLIAAGSARANGLLCRALRAVMRWAMQSCARVIAISTDMAAHLRAIYGLEGVRVIPNPALEQVRVLPCDPSPPFVVQYSGNFGAAHEYHTLLDVMRRLRDNEGILFQIAGGGSHYDAIKREAEGLPNALFEGYAPAERISERLAKADISVVIFDGAFRDALMPSKYAGILASGRPVLLISGRVNDIARDIFREGIGLSFDHGQSEAIAGALEELAARPHQARMMGRRARALYDREYAAGKAYAGYADILCE
ncbi:MAG: glycosyltransferase family 4 protein [Oscillospiraceae bacterium]|jgi:glycosyltransferase involved in cell wall biosynthesis|nr:glycosyltransferase family 4 protein [Oscillospiraceae bacterium]